MTSRSTPLETAKVYVTKYALTDGILEMPLVEVDGRMAVVEMKGGLNGKAYFHGNDWWRTRAEAEKRAESMRVQAIVKLEKKIQKLKAMKFA